MTLQLSSLNKAWTKNVENFGTGAILSNLSEAVDWIPHDLGVALFS